ncbi:hypothetical protein O0L34_g11239 [Tuta absoluta]|nr:hypothetical protein O0L34_g11239 [Tuta absoluta]
MAEEDALKVYWEHFFKAETGTYEKSTWLDLFLAEFIIRVNEGANPKELIKFCPISGVVSLVGCELLCGIHRVTSSVNARCSPLPPLDTCSRNLDAATEEPKPEDPRLLSSSALTRSTALSHTDILRQYLLRAAWRCLVLLKALGVEVSALTRSTALSHTDILRQYLLRAAWRCLVLLKALGVEVSALTRSTALSHTDILRQYLLRAAWRCLVLLKALGVEVSALTRSTALSHTDILRQYLLRAAWRCLVLLKALGVEVSALTRSTALSHTDILRQYLLRAAWRCLVLLKALGVEVSALTRSTALSHTDILRQYLLRAAWRCLVLLKALGVEVSALTRSTALSHTDILRQYLLRAAWRCLVLLKALGVEVSALTRSTALSHTDILRQYLLRAAWRCLVLLKALGVEVSALTRSTALSHTDILRQYLLRAAWRCLVLLKALGVEVSALTRSTALSHTDILRQYLLRAAWRCLVLLKALGVEVSALTRSTALSHTDILRQYLLRAAWRCLVLLKALGVEVSALTRSTALSHTDILRQYLLRAAWRCLVLLKALGVEVSALTRSTALSHTDILRQYLLRAAWRCLVLLKALGVEVSALTRSTALSHTDILRQYLLRAAWRCLVLLKALGVEVSALTRSTALSHTDILRQYLLRAAWRCLVLLKALGVEVSALTRSTALSHTDILRQYLLRAAWRCLVLLKALGVEVSALTRSTALSHTDILRQYLLRAAWRCLVLLKALGVEGMSCCRQLSSVLVWVWGELRGTGGEEGGGAAAGKAAPRAPASTATPIHQLFSHKIWTKQKLGGGSQGSKTNSAASSERSSAAGRSRHTLQVRQEVDSKTKRKFGKHSDSSDTGDSNADLQVLNRSLAVKVSTPRDDFEYFDSPGKTSNEYPNDKLYCDPFYVPKKPKPKADDYMTDKHREIINTEMSGFEFTLLILDLLQELCKTESSLSGSEGSQVSVQCINFSLRNLCSLQFGSLPQAVHYSAEQTSRVKLALTELLIVSLDKVLVHSDLCVKLINNGILPMLLRILEDIICKSSNKYSAKDDKGVKQEKPNKTEADNLLKFVFGVSYSITAFFHCLLMQCRSVEKLRAFTEQFKLYGECLKGGLLKECIELMVRIPSDEEEIITLVKKLIESLGKLITGMKRVRSEVIHSAACPRSRHKACRARVAAGMHHHHDILGEAGEPRAGLPLASSCCISVLYGTLTSLVTDEEVSAQSVLRSKILRTMLNCGVCCCFSPGFLMESIVRLMLTHNSVATLSLQVLEHTVYGELGASILTARVTDQLPCSICEPNDDKRDMIRKYCPHGVSPVDRKSMWSFLIQYNSLLQLDNHNNVLHASVSHLLRVTPKCRTEMKYELLFSVIYPTFIVAKHRYILRMEEAAYFLTVSCLNIFASLLNSVPFAEQFIQKGGLSYVLELVSLSEFSNQCCSILEIAIIVEIFKLMKDNSDMTYYREVSSLSSVRMLIKSLSETTDNCYKIYKIKLSEETFGELCDLTKEREALALHVIPEISRQDSLSSRKLSMPKAIKTSFAASENVIEDTVENYLDVLKNVWTFWKSCAGLCLYSPMFRQYIVSESVFVDSYAMLKVLLHQLCNNECSAPEMRILIKIVEALLTVQFAVSDVTSGRTKESSCELVRKALSGVNALSAGGGGGLKALCEALIRVCVARPSRHHAMPRASHAKLPPLGCESGASSAGGSSSEDSCEAPYASEHSEPSRLDPGYEADVEIGNLELLTLEKSRKVSGLSALKNISGYAVVEDEDLECAEYSKQSELAHPELCVIVVDVLTQLIQKLLTSPEDSPTAGMQRATAALARACCTRLAGALASTRCAPHTLLARLLAPHAAAAALLHIADPSKQGTAALARACCTRLAGALASTRCAPHTLLARLLAPHAAAAALLHIADPSKQGTAALARACCTRLAGALASTRCAPHTLLARLLAPHAAAAALLHIADPSKQGTAALARACCTRLAGALASTRCAPHTLLARLLAPHAAAAALLHIADPSKQGTAALARACCTRLAGALASTRCAPHTLLARLLAPHAAAAALLHIADPSKQGTAALARACCTRLAGALASTRCAPHTLLARLLAPHAAAAALLHIADPSKQGTAALARACCTRLAGALASTRCAPHTLLARLLAPHAAAAALLHIADPSKQGTAALARACCTRLAGALASTRCAPHTLLARLHIADPSKQDLQRSILELIHVVASQSITSTELAAFLRLFTAENPPLGALLTALQRLVNTAVPGTPDCILSFPVDTQHTDYSYSVSDDYVMLNNTSQSQQAESFAAKLQEAHRRAGITSPWSVGAVRCGVEGAGWAPWLQGFGLLLWVRAAPPTPPSPPSPPPDSPDEDWYSADEWNEPEEPEVKKSPVKESSIRSVELSHVMSIGTESLVLEIWMDTNTGSLTIRLTRPELGANKVVSEARVGDAAPAHKWASLALNVTERVYKRRIHIQVTVLVNGLEIETVSLPLQGILVRKVMPTLVVIGHCARGAVTGAYHLSHSHVYRAPVLNVYTALHLTAHSPDHSCQVRCDTPNYPLIITPEVLDSNIDWDQVYDISSNTLRDLHENLLLTFSASSPNIMNLYHQTVSLPTVFAGRVATTASLMGSATSASHPQGGASVPEALYVTWGGQPLTSTHRGVAPALYMLQGPAAIMPLLPRVRCSHTLLPQPHAGRAAAHQHAPRRRARPLHAAGAGRHHAPAAEGTLLPHTPPPATRRAGSRSPARTAASRPPSTCCRGRPPSCPCCRGYAAPTHSSINHTQGGQPLTSTHRGVAPALYMLQGPAAIMPLLPRVRCSHTLLHQPHAGRAAAHQHAPRRRARPLHAAGAGRHHAPAAEGTLLPHTPPSTTRRAGSRSPARTAASRPPSTCCRGRPPSCPCCRGYAAPTHSSINHTQGGQPLTSTHRGVAPALYMLQGPAAIMPLLPRVRCSHTLLHQPHAGRAAAHQHAPRRRARPLHAAGAGRHHAPAAEGTLLPHTPPSTTRRAGSRSPARTAASRPPSTCCRGRPPSCPCCRGYAAPTHSSINHTQGGQPLTSTHRGVAPALYMLQGPAAIMPLLPRVVELEGSVEEQAQALAIILRICRADNRLYSMFYDGHSLQMLHTVLASNKCICSHHMLKVFLDEACSSTILSVSGNSLVISARCDAVVLEPSLLLLLMRAWRQLHTAQDLTWEMDGPGGRTQERGSLWALTLCCLQVLVRDEHPRRSFNQYQLTRARLLQGLLSACKERFLNSECGPLEPAASTSLVQLVRGLMGSPPQLERLVLLADFLLLMHQASDTFVTHSRANFYFLLAAETQDSSEFQLHFKRRPSRRARARANTATSTSAGTRRSEVTPSSSSVTSDDVINSDHVAKEEDRLDHSSVDSTKLVKGIINMQLKEGSEVTSSSSNVTSGEMVNENSGIMKEEDHSSVDSTKLVKGIINMQIKEGRKHNISSTSENSDVTFERSTSIEHKADEHTAHTHTRARPQLTGEGVAGGGGEGGLEGSGKEDLKEFIVVDADDVTTATVDMYSSGIFHQRTVKAGAEPGWSACEGLLLLLRDTIAVLPDHALAQAVAGAIQAEVLIVLGNHRSGRVRAALVRAMAGLARRAPADLAKKLRANNYYVHLANQISLYPATWELAAACAALLTKCDVPLEDQLDDDIWLDINEEAVLRSPPLLALLPVCLDDVPLAHNITLLIRRLIDKASLKTLNEVSVAEVVIKAIRGIGQLGSADFEGRDLLLDDLFELLNRLAVKASNSQHNLQTITEIHHMLTYVEWSGAARGETAVVRVARDAQHSLYMAQLDHLEDRLHTSYTAHTKYANYFTTVLSSAVSIGAEAVSRAERTELASRHLATVVRAVSFLLTQSPRHSAVEEAPLVERLFATLLPAVSGAAPTRPKWWVGGGADWVSPLQDLFCWAASPAPGVQPLQAGLLRALYRAPPPALPLLAPPDPPAMRKLAVYLLTMLKHIHAEAEAGTPPVELAITDWARGWAVGTQAGLAERVPSDTLIVEAERLLEIDEERWAKIAAKQRPQVAKVVYSKDGLAHRLTEGAMLITRQVVDIQNGERKAFMELLRRAHSDAVACTQRWARAVDALTHEQAVWHDPRSYPQSWQLDATEGVGRVRVRLRRAHLDIQDKFLLPNSRGKLEAINRSPPLRSVVGCYAGLRGGLVARLQLNETVSYMTRVTYVTVCSETEGELLLSDRCIHFVPEDSEDEATPPKKGARPMSKSSAQSWPLEAVVQVATRRWCLQERAAELFLSSGHAHLLAFTDFNERAVFLKALERCHLPGRQEPDTLTEAMTQWRNGAITNWEYLMRLNGLAGRTYNDLMQYPVLPFILADYTSRILDLDNPASFRDLSKPMAIQNKNREQHYINTYNDLKMARREGCSPLLRQAQPHHYASLYSNSGGVLHYLVRLPPFTELFLNYQGE